MRWIALFAVAVATSAGAHPAGPVLPSPAALPPPRASAAAEPAPAAGTTRGNWPVPTWTRDVDAALAGAKQLGRRTLLVFCAVWTGSCLEMSGTTFADPRVVRLLGGPVVPVAVDVTRADEDPVATALEARYGVSGLPTLILLDATGRELARANQSLNAAALLALLAAPDLPPRSQRACPRVLARAQSYVTDLALWGGHLYWVAEGTMKLGLADAAIRRVGLDGLGLETVADASGPRGLLVDATGVFWTAEPISEQNGQVRATPSTARAGTIWFLPNVGGKPRLLVTGLVDPLFLKASSDRLFVSSGRQKTVLALPRAGGPPQALGEAPGRVSQIALDATHVYFTVDEYHSGKVGRVPRAGGPVEILADGLDRPWGVVVDDSYVYFTTQGGYLGKQLLGRVAKTGGPYEALASLPRPRRLAIQGEWLYVATEQGIAKVGRAGGLPRFLSSTAANVVAVDGAYVYVAEAADTITCVPNPGP